MNSIVALPIVAATPTTAPMFRETSAAIEPGDNRDQELVDAAAGMFAADTEIERLHKTYGDDADGRADYDQVGNERHRHIETLIVKPAIGHRGMLAKAHALMQQQLQEGDEHSNVAVSLAKDVIDAGFNFAVIDGKSHEMKSEAAALVERCIQGDRRWDVLYDKILCAEEAAWEQFGHRPSELIEWRNYSAIGGSELERVRNEFLREGVDGAVVQREYRDAKKRYRQALNAGEDWDRKVGIAVLREELERIQVETRNAWEALSKVPMTCTSDAIAILGVLRSRAHRFDELSEGWEVKAFMHASRFLVRAAA